MEHETKTTLLILIFCLAITFFVMLLYVFISISKRRILEKENKFRQLEAKRQVELFSATAKAEESQKVKIAMNLHDQIVSVLLVKTRNINNRLVELESEGLNVTGIKNDLEAIEFLADEIRDIAHDLIPKLFTTWGLIKSIEVFIRNMNEGGSSVAEFHNSIEFSGEPPFSKDDQLIIYRICLEILNNLSKHTHYEYLNVSLEEISENFTMVFAHNGKGISNQEIITMREKENGIGLKSLQSRALILNAEIDYFKDKEVSHVKLTVPVKK